MMFYRGPGQLESELAQMDECMPHYYKITCGHGQGAEKIMRAEAAFVQGRFADAQIELERAYAQIEGNGQENMALCCDFLAWRLALAKEMKPHCSLERRRTELLRHIMLPGLIYGVASVPIIMRCWVSLRRFLRYLVNTGFRISICLPREDQ